MWMTSRRLADSAVYSASVVLSATSVCSLDAHTMGQPAYVMMYPVRDLAVDGSTSAVVLFQFPTKSASAVILWIENQTLM